MPQLSIETFVAQYFWLIAILGLFYILSIAIVIPAIANIYKTRRKIQESQEQGSEEEKKSLWAKNNEELALEKSLWNEWNKAAFQDLNTQNK